jgi:putative tricarboxylic transport membrane protein
MFIIGLVLMRGCVYVTRIPKTVVAVIIVTLAVVGSYAVNNSFFDVWLMVSFGALGYVLDRARIPVAPMIIGLVLGTLLDSSLTQSLLMGFGNWTVFTDSPIAFGLLLLACLSILQATPILKLFINIFYKKKRT